MMMMNRDALYEYSDDEKDVTAIARASSGSRGSGSSHGNQPERSKVRNRSTPQPMGRENATRKAPASVTRTSMRRSSAGEESSRESYVSDNTSSSASSEASPPVSVGRHTIALFGGSGKVGQAFLHHALDAGYQVRRFVTKVTNEQSTANDREFDDTTTDTTGAGTSTHSTQLLQNIFGSSLGDTDAIEETLQGVHFVVCLLNDAVTAKTYPSNRFLSAFVERLYPLMKQVPSIQLFVLQSISLAPDMHGTTPVLSKLVKVAAHATGRTLQLVDHDCVMKYLAMEHGHRKNNRDQKREADQNHSNVSAPHFHYLVTRPTVFVKDGPASKRLCASKSQPGPFSVSTGDLADFTLNALLDAKLYDSTPYVVSANGL